MSSNQNGKGDTPRPYDKEKFYKSWDRIFKKKKRRKVFAFTATNYLSWSCHR